MSTTNPFRQLILYPGTGLTGGPFGILSFPLPYIPPTPTQTVIKDNGEDYYTADYISLADSGATAGTYYFPKLTIQTTGIISAIDSHGYEDASANLFLSNNAGNNTLSGINNVGIGYGALKLISGGNYNFGLGAQALASLTGGSGNAMVGFQSGASIVNNNSNVGFGYGALAALLTGDDNTSIGARAGIARTSYSSCTFLGYSADATTGGLSNSGAIGANATISVSNGINIGSGTYVGVNQPSPAYSLDLANVSSQCGLRLAASTGTPTTPGNTNDIVIFNNAGAPYWKDTGGTLHAFGSGSGSVTSLTAGTGITLTPSTITTTGTIALTTPVALTNGGTNASLTASNGGIVYSTASALAILSGTSTARQMLQSGASTTPAWSTATWPATTTINQILYSSAANTVTGLATANSSVLVTNSSGVPSLTNILPAIKVQATNTDAFDVQNSGGSTTHFKVDTTNSVIYLNDVTQLGGFNNATAFYIQDSGANVYSSFSTVNTASVYTATQPGGTSSPAIFLNGTGTASGSGTYTADGIAFALFYTNNLGNIQSVITQKGWLGDSTKTILRVYAQQSGVTTMVVDCVKGDNSGSAPIYFGNGIYANSDNSYTCGASGHRWSAVWAANGTIQTSAQSQKNNVIDSPLGLDFINKLQPKCWKWNNGPEQTKTHHGFVYEDVASLISPEYFGGLYPAENLEHDIRDEETKEIKKFVEEGTHGLNYAAFIAPMVSAIQTLSQKVMRLEAQLEAA